MTPQPVLSPLSRSALFLVLGVAEGAEEAVREALPQLADRWHGVRFRSADGHLTLVTGIGSDLWDRMFGEPKPAQLHPFRALTGPKHTAPATPGDLLLHIRAESDDLCFELGWKLLDLLGDAVTVIDETHGFRFFEQRDLLGFVDGTENPDGAAAQFAAVIDQQDPDFAGGSYVTVQKYVHDMTAWHALTVEQQERVIGRTKLDDIEFSDEVKAPDSHVTLNTLDDRADGTAREILRDNMPFGRLGEAEFGTYYIAYAADLAVTELMLERMFCGDPPGTYDRILDFSTALTGNVFFCPSQDFLDDPPAYGEPPAADPPAPEGDDGLLKIGSLHP